MGSTDGNHEEGERKGAAQPHGAQPHGKAHDKHDKRDTNRAKRKKKDKPREPRERPPFGVGDLVFGKVTDVTFHCLFIDLAGKAIAIFDRRELEIPDEPIE